MGEQLKLIVTELQKEPFNKKYNIISFDTLNGEQLLQVTRVCSITGSASARRWRGYRFNSRPIPRHS